ncbi:type III-A CRISPR-associated CARF protein Csm6 [Streptococcus cristatus]|uniref:CRISPR-associated protein n=1 Tax=Streptococcus cristatus TaxID=45634 RepID=A0A428ANC9_STRCR|nr:hypothetical protein [Streptococcus cristatus]RSI44825.1 CRISPR-associated protein [Streptococcus cristatus]
MKTLITFISQYDPIGVEFVDTKQDNADGRKKRFRPEFGQELTLDSVENYEKDGYGLKISDGAALFIIKNELPDKIIVIYSDEMKVKQENFEAAVKAVYDGKKVPEIQNKYVKEGVHEFDTMYKFVEEILDEEDMSHGDYILNVTSGTPQCQAAMYAINFVKDYNTRLARVNSPRSEKTNQSNQGAPWFETDTFKYFLEKQALDSKDNRQLGIEKGEKFKNNLLQRTYKDFILKYEYKAALEILKKNPDIISDKQDHENSKNILENMISVFQKQRVLEELAADFNLTYNNTDEFQKVLNYYLMIDILNRKGQVTDVLVKAKSFAEFVLKSVIKIKYPDIKKFNDKKIKDFNIFESIDYLEYHHEYSEFKTPISKIIAVNTQRNKVAHGLAEISVEQEELDELVKGLKELVIAAYSDIDASLYQKYFNYYDIKNRELISCIK